MARATQIIYGNCHLCGGYGKLTFEHVPPRCAFNAEPAVVYTYDQWLAATGRGRGRYESQQRGSGYTSLCEACNNRGGTLYVPEYELWVRAGGEIVQGLLDVDTRDLEAIRATLHGVRPALFAKQVVLMLLALNRCEVGDKNPALREYVLHREAVGLPERYRLFLGIFDGEVARFGGVYTAMREDGSRPPFHATDLVYPPFIYTLTIDEQAADPRPGEITWFTGIDPDDERDVKLRLPYNLAVFPLDHKIPERLAS